MSLTPKKILIIEDNETYLDVLSQKLSIEKYDVLTAKDGPNGIQQTIDHQPDIILIDLLLPKMNGIEVLEKIRNVLQTSRTKLQLDPLTTIK